jgi:hypothetical protein
MTHSRTALVHAVVKKKMDTVAVSIFFFTTALHRSGFTAGCSPLISQRCSAHSAESQNHLLMVYIQRETYGNVSIVLIEYLLIVFVGPRVT